MSEAKGRDKQIEQLLAMIKTWIETESGPTLCGFWHKDLALSVKIRGYRKVILERDFERAKRETL